MMEKPIPAIATRALTKLEAVFVSERNKVILEMADVVGVDLKEGWKLNETATAFVKDDKPKGTDGDGPK